MTMNKVNKLALAVATIAALGAVAASSAYARVTSNGRSLQGTLRSGIALQSLESNRPVVTVVTLSSGETFDLRQQDPTQPARK
jgi:hypothetical protein